MGLIQEIGSATYHSQMKYEMMWKIIKLGNLLEQILPENVLKGVNIDIARSANGKSIDEMNNSQQWSLFKIARDLCADFSHILYENDTEKFITSTINIWQGKNTIDEIIDIRARHNNFARGSNIEKAVRNNSDAQAKMLNQMGYFLLKAKTFIEQGNMEGACMAFIGAGNCARAVNISKINDSLKLAITNDIMDVRKILTHFTTRQSHLQEINQVVKDTYGDIDNYIKLLEEDAKKLKLDINIEEYYKTEKPTQDAESPRIHKRNI